MKLLSHSAIDSPIFKLLDVYQLDLFFMGDGYKLRIELFQDIENEKNYRCSFWQVEVVEVDACTAIKPSLETDKATYLIQVDWSAYLSSDYSSFAAESPDDALAMVMKDLRAYIVHTSDSED